MKKETKKPKGGGGGIKQNKSERAGGRAEGRSARGKITGVGAKLGDG